MARKPFLGILDWYIIRKFLATYITAMVLILAISVVFDVAEKIDDFISRGATLHEVVVDYYFNFIPYFGSLFSSLFVFIAVIFFTTKLTTHSEIIAMQSSGMSLARILRPYMVTAMLIFTLNWVAANYIIPPANQKRIKFEHTYIKGPSYAADNNVHRQVRPGIFVYYERYNHYAQSCHSLTIERFEDKELKSKFWGLTAQWDSINETWAIDHYYIRNYHDRYQTITSGTNIDTTFFLTPKDLGRTTRDIESMDRPTLNAHIEQMILEGAADINFSYAEKYQRLSAPFSTFILTFIGVCVSTRKVRGSMGRYLGLGLALSFTYILAQRFTLMFTLNGGMEPLLAVWLPNITYAIIAIFIYRKAKR